MAFVVPLENFTPPARTDAPWTGVRIFESTAPNGPWTLIQTINFADPDVDPLNPKTRSWTTTLAALESGWYSVIFIDAGGNTSQRSSSVRHGSDVSDVNYRPSVKDVGDLIRSRTIDDDGNELGTFTSATRPNASQVNELIDNALAEAVGIFGTTVPDAPAQYNDVDAYRKAVAQVVATYAAALVERTHFGKEVARENSPYKQLMIDYERMLARIAKMLGIVLEDVSEGAATNSNQWVPLGSHNSFWGNDVIDPWSDIMTRPH